MTNIEAENKIFLDVVNEDDETIDSKSRTDIHQLGLLHREVHVWMFTEDKNVIFQKRGLHRPSAGLLDATAGGHPNQGETYIDAAIRETKEETGLMIVPNDLILLKKLKKVSNPSDSVFLGTVNNFIRAVYIYKNPIDEKELKKEVGIPGAGFKKLSYELLLNLPEEYLELFDKFILTEEVPQVLKYLKEEK